MDDLSHSGSFGEALKFLRLNAKVTQVELAADMQLEPSKKGGGGASQIHRWESGAVIPQPASIHAIARVLKLAYYDTFFLLGMAGHLGQTQLPPLKEIIISLNAICEHIRGWKYPAYITDYRFRCWAANAATSVFTQEDLGALEYLAGEGVNTFDLSFRGDLGTRNSTTNPRDTQDFQMFRFKANNLYRRHEPFYRGFVQYMTERLEFKNDNAIVEIAEFRECWNKIDFKTLKTFRIDMPLTIPVRGYNCIFRSYDVPIPHLQNLFQISYCEPVTEQKKYEELFTDIGHPSKKCIKVWDIKHPALIFKDNSLANQ